MQNVKFGLVSHEKALNKTYTLYDTCNVSRKAKKTIYSSKCRKLSYTYQGRYIYKILKYIKLKLKRLHQWYDSKKLKLYKPM